MSEIKETARKVMPGRCKSAELVRNSWAITVEHGTSREDIKRPEFWALVSKNFRPYDRIEARADDGTFFAEYIVLSADRAWARVHELRFEALGTQDVSLTEAAAADIRARYTIKYNGPHLKYCVERQDGEAVERLQQGMDKPAATIWLEQHLKTVGAIAVPA